MCKGVHGWKGVHAEVMCLSVSKVILKRIKSNIFIR